MPEFYCHCECLKCPPPALSSNTSLQSLSLVDRSLWQVAPDNLIRSLDFSDCFRLCFELAVSLQNRTPHVIACWNYIRRIWRPLVFRDEIWTVGLQPVLCAVCADAPSCRKMNPVGSRRLL